MLTTLLVFIPTAFIFAMIPGPDFALIVRTALLHGKKAAIAAAFGISMGLVIHTSLSVAGLAAIIVSSPLLFSILQYAGAGYLTILGIQAFLPKRRTKPAPSGILPESSKGETSTAAPAPEGGISSARAFRQGFLTNSLNPKAVLFYLTFLPQFIAHKAAFSPTMQLLILGACMCLTVLTWFVLFSLLLSRLRRYFTSETFRRLDYITGLIFIGFGAKVAFFS